MPKFISKIIKNVKHFFKKKKVRRDLESGVKVKRIEKRLHIEKGLYKTEAETATHKENKKKKVA